MTEGTINAWAASQHALIDRIARGEALSSVLDALARTVEAHLPDVRCAILLDEATGTHAAAAVGSCGATTHPLGSCAIVGAKERILGTVTFYVDDPSRTATLEHERILRETAAIASVAIENAHATEAARQQRDAWVRLFEENPNPMWFFDRETLRFLEVNQAAVRVYGWSREEFAAMTIEDIRPREDRAKLAVYLANKEGDRGHAVAWRHLRKDGTEMEVEVASHSTEWKGRSARVVTILDITEKRQAQRELEMSSARLEAVVASAMDAIISVDEAQRIVLFNTAAERIFGVRASEVLGGRLDRFLPRAAREAHAEHMRDFANTGESTRAMGASPVLRAVRANGTEFPIEATISRGDVHGRAIMTVILRDVTERHRLETQLRHAQKMDALGRLAGGVAHDFNNLLTVMRASAELLGAASVPEERHEYASEIVALVDRASALTRQLLAFSRNQPIEPRVLALDEVIGNTEKMLGRVIGEAIRLEVRPEAPSARVLADAGQIEQVLVNLAVNARDAMPEGGTLAIRSSIVEPSSSVARTAIALGGARGLRLDGPLVHLSVRDTGVGMDEATRHRAFEPFFTTKEAGKGTGLGLATVYGIIAQSGGVTWIESEVGRGTVVNVVLPLSDQAPASRILSSRTHVLKGKGDRLLLVEDEPALRRAAARILERAGYKVTSAGNGVEALAVLDQAIAAGEPPQIVVTDVVMPRMGGRDFVNQVRARVPELPVVYMSGYVEGGVQQSDLDGRTVFMQKPFSSEALLGILADLERPP